MFYLRRGGVPEMVSAGLHGLTRKPACLTGSVHNLISAALSRKPRHRSVILRPGRLPWPARRTVTAEGRAISWNALRRLMGLSSALRGKRLPNAFSLDALPLSQALAALEGNHGGPSQSQPTSQDRPERRNRNHEQITHTIDLAQ
jgi:hypothetical protein